LSDRLPFQVVEVDIKFGNTATLTRRYAGRRYPFQGSPIGTYAITNPKYAAFPQLCVTRISPVTLVRLIPKASPVRELLGNSFDGLCDHQAQADRSDLSDY